MTKDLQLDGFMSHLKTTMAGGKVSMQEMQTNVRNRVGHLSNKLETMCGPSGASIKKIMQLKQLRIPSS